MTEKQTNSDEKLSAAYDRMLDRAHELMERAEHDALPAVRKAIDFAKQTAVEVGELTVDEAEKVGSYLRRDLDDAANNLAETGRDLRTWLKFDFALIEERVGEALARMVDQTQLELSKLQAMAQSDEEWHTGEIAGPGPLTCVACGHEIHKRKSGRIPPCPKCHKSIFIRSAGAK